MSFSFNQMASKGKGPKLAPAAAPVAAVTAAVPETWEDLELPEEKAPIKSTPKKKGFGLSFPFMS